MNDIIEGDFEEKSSNTGIVKHSDNAGAVRVFSPLDAEPVEFTRMLETRQENYDNLREHLFSVLVPGKDFGKIHVAKGCDNKYTCTNSYHFSGYELFAPGADKILGILSLTPEYPGYEDYIRAAVTGHKISEVIMKCEIIGHAGGPAISNGMGACERSEGGGKTLNNTIKMACKRARVDAVKRLPTISALFEDDILADLEAAAKRNANNAARKRTQIVKQRWNTGAVLETCPIGTDIKGKRWVDIETAALEWIINKVTDKPDVFRAASRELTHRASVQGSSSIRTEASPDLSDEK